MEAGTDTMLLSLKWERPNLEIVDQLVLPHKHVWVKINTSNDAFTAIKTMQVRGAPAIAVVAGLGLAAEVISDKKSLESGKDAVSYLKERMSYLRRARPTAVNLAEAMDLLTSVVDTAYSQILTESDLQLQSKFVVDSFVEAAEGLLVRDISDNKAIGKFGCEYITSKYLQKVSQNSNTTGSNGFSVLTHCNTGSLATAGYGTALGIIRSLSKNSSDLKHVYCTETRPYNQGSRLTAYELLCEKIPFTLCFDSSISYLIQQLQKKAETNDTSSASSPVFAIIVGADRVTRNGDTANKIGTYQLALLARNFGLEFIVAVPSTSIDLKLSDGDSIPIEYRASEEVTMVSGMLVSSERGVDAVGSRATVRVAPEGEYGVYNPGFDVTPANLITAIVTEKGTISTKLPDGTFDIESFLSSV
ncbi:Methylthioribose-1-phosphate isomerase [Smittium culicis]|uniref:Methylthioribose-1-phosphate isomerase n=1 Tax=Smittium culicis TaxID=133412 RepID=A0A1R1XGN8_9FUNG|nr:Methylthioribose-1-phosphate isomerase [Smittium culicis]